MPRLPAFTELTDLNLDEWREQNHIWTDSLWFIEERDRSGAHTAGFHGNYVPQIPNQFIQRYTRPREWVLDPFVGAGTTMLEARRLGRNSLGVDVDPKAISASREALQRAGSPDRVVAHLVEGDSRDVDLHQELRATGGEEAALLMLHPPYHDIIKFTEDPRDLSNAPSLDDFVGSFEAVLTNCLKVLGLGRMVVIVIGDKYAAGEWIPLGFHLMSVATGTGLQLKSVIVKNFTQNTAGKRSTQALWRYRALRGGFYVFRHEYILVLRKVR